MRDTGVFHTEETGTSLRVAQVLGMTGSAFLCGKTFSHSFATPALLLAPAPLLAKQWKKMFDSDRLVAPLVVLFSGGVFSFLAFRQPKLSQTSMLHATSATLLAACIPYSYLTLEPINEKLEGKAASYALVSATETDSEVGVRREETVHYLVDRWATFNLGRTVLTGVSALLAAWAAVDRLQLREFRVTSGAEKLRG